jgi:hypothetical protein
MTCVTLTLPLDLVVRDLTRVSNINKSSSIAVIKIDVHGSGALVRLWGFFDGPILLGKIQQVLYVRSCWL